MAGRIRFSFHSAPAARTHLYAFAITSICFLFLFDDAPFVTAITGLTKTQLRLEFFPDHWDRIRDISELPPSLFEGLVFPTPYRLSNESSIVDFTSYPTTSDQFYRNDTEYIKYYAELSFTWERIHNVHAVHWGGILLGDYVYYYNFREQRCEPSTSYIVHCHDIVFNHVHRWFYYGHYIIDYIPVLTVLSQYYLENACFIVRQRTLFSVTALQLFGIPDAHILDLPYGHAIFARQVIMIRPLQMQVMNGLLLERMRAVFVEKLGLDFVKPFRFVIYNRKGKRYVLNCYKLFDRFVPLFPNITLELYEDAFQANVSANIRYYNEMLFAFGCHSSGFLNIIFQQSNTVFAVVESKQSDGHLFVGIAKIFKRHAFIYRDFQFEHSARVLKLPMNQIVPLVELAIRRAIKIQENNVRTEKADCVSALLSFGFSIDPPS